MNSFLPDHSGPIEKALEKAFVGHIERYVLPDLWDPTTCPENVLPFLADAVSVPYWDESWTTAQKRSSTAQSISVHQRMGSLPSVEKALESAGFGDAVIMERYGWEVHDGQHLRDGSINRHQRDHWAEYRVILSRPISIEQANQVREILKRVAPTRCHLKLLDFVEAQNLYNAQITRNGVQTRGIV